jgi:hypothetical protein
MTCRSFTRSSYTRLNSNPEGVGSAKGLEAPVSHTRDAPSSNHLLDASVELILEALELQTRLQQRASRDVLVQRQVVIHDAQLVAQRAVLGFQLLTLLFVAAHETLAVLVTKIMN